MGLVEDKGGYRVIPVDSLFTTRRVKNGHAGFAPLPIVDMDGGYDSSIVSNIVGNVGDQLPP